MLAHSSSSSLRKGDAWIALLVNTSTPLELHFSRYTDRRRAASGRADALLYRKMMS